MLGFHVFLSSCGSCSEYVIIIIISAFRIGPSSWPTQHRWNYTSWFSAVSSIESVPTVTGVLFTRVPSSDAEACWSDTGSW